MFEENGTWERSARGKGINLNVFSLLVPRVARGQELQGFPEGAAFVKRERAACSLLHLFPASIDSLKFHFSFVLACVDPVVPKSRDKVVLTSTNDLCALFLVSG
jgi:hypothetical protein